MAMVACCSPTSSGAGSTAGRPAGVSLVLPRRRGVGGLVPHVGGELLVSGRDLSLGSRKIVTAPKGVTGFNDLVTTDDGSVLVGAMRFRPMLGEPGAPGEIWRVGGRRRAQPVRGRRALAERHRALARGRRGLREQLHGRRGAGLRRRGRQPARVRPRRRAGSRTAWRWTPRAASGSRSARPGRSAASRPTGSSTGRSSCPGQFAACVCASTKRRLLLAAIRVSPANACRRGGAAGAARQTSCYLSSTLPPASSISAFSFSASSRSMPSLTGFGASSTRAFASLRPRPVAARTTLMTWIFLSPEPVRTTSTVVDSSSAAAPSRRRARRRPGPRRRPPWRTRRTPPRAP